MKTLKTLIDTKKTVEVATHFGMFHADEISAIALLKVFFSRTKFEVTRLPHQSSEEELSKFDLVIDIGRVLDVENGRFDHHQYKGGMSSAGLIWSEIKNILGEDGNIYPKIDELVQAIDKHDTGEQRSGEFEYSRLIGRLKDFDTAIEFAVQIFQSLKKEAEAIQEVKDLVVSAEVKEGFIIFPLREEDADNLPWREVINGCNMPEISGVVQYNKKSSQWEATLAPINSESFAFTKGKGFNPEWKEELKLDFVHANGFFACSKSKEPVMALIKRYNESLKED